MTGKELINSYGRKGPSLLLHFCKNTKTKLSPKTFLKQIRSKKKYKCVHTKEHTLIYKVIYENKKAQELSSPINFTIARNFKILSNIKRNIHAIPMCRFISRSITENTKML